jgi:hypothetical protein
MQMHRNTSWDWELRLPTFITGSRPIRSKDDRVRHEELERREALATRRRHFGDAETIRATRLGNAFEALTCYTYRCYQIEANLFWPRLKQILDPGRLQPAEEPRIAMDFALTCATLAAVYGSLAMLLGPWLYDNFTPWLIVGIVAAIVSRFFYHRAVNAAQQYGDMYRASVDLFRLNLMQAMSRPHPASLSVERQQWEQLSQLAVYGDAARSDFALRPLEGGGTAAE